MTKKKVTTEEELIVIKKYLSGKKVSELTKEYNYSKTNHHGILNILKKHNISIRPDNITHSTKYFVDSNYFEKVDNQNKAYILGLLYADGYNGISSNSIRLMLQKEDKDILDIIRKEIKTDKPLRLYQKSLKNPNWKDMYALDIENKKMCKDLNNLGCIQAKTFKIVFPYFLKDEYISHFIRGYFDGDGCITYSKKNMYISFVGTSEFLNSLKIIFTKELNFSDVKFSKRHKDKNDNIYNLLYGGNKQISKFKTWLYKDAQIFMKRKFDKFL